MSTDNLDLDALEALLTPATPGPWEAKTSEATMNDRSEWRLGPANRPQVARSIMRGSDAALIVALVNAAPELIAAARERDVLAGQVEAVRGVADRASWFSLPVGKNTGVTVMQRMAHRDEIIQALDAPDGGAE